MKKLKGFSLVELILVLSIAGTCAAMTTNLRTPQKTKDLEAIRKSFRDVVLFCRTKAMYSKEPVSLELDAMNMKFLAKYSDNEGIPHTFEKDFRIKGISSCALYPLETSMQADPKPKYEKLSKVVLKKVLTTPFQLKFNYNGENMALAFNENSQIEFKK